MPNRSEASIGSTKPLIDKDNSTQRMNHLILIIISSTSVLSPISNSIYYPAIMNIREYFQTTKSMVNALTALFTLFFGSAPLIWGSYSDTFGQRRKSYLIAITISTFSSIVCLVSPNIWLLMFARTLQACGLAAMNCLSASVISDVYTHTGNIWLMTFTNYIIIPRVFSSQYHISTSMVGLIFLAPGIGFMIGSMIGGKYSDYIVSKFISNEIYPEVRLKGVWFSCILVPIAFLAYGWFLQLNAKIYWPIIFIFIGSFGTLFTVSILSIYLVDSHQDNCASVIALSDCVSSLIGGLFQLLLSPLQNSLGIGWIFTLLIAINLSCSLLIVIVYLRGNSWRIKYNTFI
ncbi:major facilitator superfamily domain-containing protein [Glomus cerebriforme]|uniref:Major facilitator superfamily domain-containing protein n=1 Tax=Glomus cerebriforme TaxID=658196 RepID=A0A397T968_9GLOM|nr:major facilitator superfamily domain-containing protein [Glomus cerebriforme]